MTDSSSFAGASSSSGPSAARLVVAPLASSLVQGAGEEAVAGVDAWRADLQASMAEKGEPKLDPEALVWAESGSATPETFPLGAGLVGVRLLAVYADRTDAEWPDLLPRIPELDPNYRAAADANWSRSRFGQLLAATLWLPAAFDFTIDFPLPDGRPAELGSAEVLLEQIERLNAVTVQLDSSILSDSAAVDVDAASGDFVDAAICGLGGFYRAVSLAVEQRLPLLLAI